MAKEKGGATLLAPALAHDLRRLCPRHHAGAELGGSTPLLLRRRCARDRGCVSARRGALSSSRKRQHAERPPRARADPSPRKRAKQRPSDRSATAPQASRWQKPWAFAVLFAVALVPYLRTLGFGYTYDDHAHVQRNAFLSEPSNLWRLLTEYFRLEVPDQARPVLLASHFLDRALGGGQPAVAHAQSALWHALATVLVACLGTRVGARPAVAFGAGVLFALHPALAEAVAGISNREDVLATVFGLGALLLARRGMEGKLAAAGLATSLFALALFSKEVAVVLPVLFLLFWRGVPSWRRRATRPGLLALGAGAVLALICFAVVQVRLGTPGLHRDAGASPLRGASAMSSGPPLAAAVAPTLLAAPTLAAASERELHAPLAYVHALPLESFRLVQLTVGVPTSAEYDLAPFRSLSALLVGALLLFVVAAAAVRVRRSAPVVTLGLAWILVATAPVFAPPLLLNPLADRFLYLPAVGAAWILSFLALEGLPRLSGRDVRDVGVPAFLAWVGLFIALGIPAIGRWRDDVALFSHAAKWAPSSARVQLNLGAALRGVGQNRQAEVALREAARLDPALVAAHLDLGLLAERTQRRAEAIEHYRAGLAQHSIRGELGLRERMLSRLGELLLRRRRFDGVNSRA